MSKFLLLNHRTFAKCFVPSNTLVNRSMSLVTSTNPGGERDSLPLSAAPSLKSYPLLGHLPSALMQKNFSPKTFNQFIEELATKYGKVTLCKLPLQPPMVILSDPDYIESMYNLTKDNPLRDPPASFIDIRKRTRNDFFENKMGLIAENNEEWWRVRSKAQTPMMKPKNIQRFLPKVDKVACELTDRIAELQLEHGEMPKTFIFELYKWALESVGLVALNKRLGCFDKNLDENSDQLKLINSVNTMFESLSELEFSPLPYWKLYPTKNYRLLRDAHNVFLDIVLKNINTVEEELKQKTETGTLIEDLTLLEILLLTEGLTRKDVITILLDLFFAGIDTATHTLSFTFYCLARNPIAQKRMQAELDNVLGDGKRVLTANDLAKLTYTKHCIKESMRLFPTVFGVQRITDNEINIGGYTIPKDHMIITNQGFIGKSEKYFQHPTEYLPERWARERPLGTIHPYALLQFSHGTRMCIGRRIAEQEMYTMLCRTMHRFNVDYKYEDMGLILKLISCPSKPLRFEFTERRK